MLKQPLIAKGAKMIKTDKSQSPNYSQEVVQIQQALTFIESLRATTFEDIS